MRAWTNVFAGWNTQLAAGHGYIEKLIEWDLGFQIHKEIVPKGNMLQSLPLAYLCY